MQRLVSLVENVCESKFKDALYPTVCQRIPPVSTSTIIIFISAFASWTREIWSDMKLSLLPSARLLHWKPVLRRLSSTCRIVMVRNYSVTKNNFPNLRVGKKCPHIYFCVFCICSGMRESCFNLCKVLHCGIQNCSVAFSVFKQLSTTWCLPTVFFLKYIWQVSEYYLGLCSFYHN